MGGCISISCGEFQDLTPPSPSPSTAMVISLGGDLREYNAPAMVSQVMEAELLSSSLSASSYSSYFICSSDSLYYDDKIPAMKSEDKLVAGQIYFVLPNSKRQNRLTASDMAALAVKASVALQTAAKKDSRRRKRTRISPVLILNQTGAENNDQMNNYSVSEKVKGKPAVAPPYAAGGGFSRSGSVRKLQRYSSKKAKIAVRSFRLKLSTIYEGVVV